MTTSTSDDGMWRWGDVFELAIGDGFIVKHLDDAIEIGLAHGHGDPDARIHLAVLTPEAVSDPLVSAHEAIVRFGQTRGIAVPGPRVELASDGAIAQGRFAFVAGDVAWLALAVAWGRHVVFFAASAAHREDPIFDHAEALASAIVPVERLTAAALPPEVAGDF